MLDAVNLIHMNGRVYDPVLGRFLSADPIIQTLAISQAINAFSYVMNNPLSLIDPSGYSWLSKLFSGIGSFLKKWGPMILSIALTFVAGPYIAALVNWAISGGNIGSFITGFAVGLITGGIAGSLGGSLFQTVGLVGKGFLATVLRGAIVGGLAGGISSVAMGGTFGAGFTGGAIGGALSAAATWKPEPETTAKPENKPPKDSHSAEATSDADSADHGAPARMVPISAENKGGYQEYEYQLVDADGHALTGPGYSAAEFIVPGDTTQNANGKFVRLHNGIFTDDVGWNMDPVPLARAITVTHQSFVVLYRGATYALTTVFEHVNMIVSGTPVNAITIVHP